MSNDALSVLQCLFQTIWRLFTSWDIPGTNVSPAEMFLFLISAGIGLRFALSFLTGNRAGARSALQDDKFTDEAKLQSHLLDMELRK